MSDIEREAAAAAAWLRDQAQRTPFGTVTVALTLHGGQVTRTERGVSETHKPGNGVHHERTGN